MTEKENMKLTLEQHIELGERVKQFRETLMQPHVLCIGTKSSRENRAVLRMLLDLRRMRSRWPARPTRASRCMSRL